MTLLSKAEKCWETTPPEEHWAAWLKRKERFEEEQLVRSLVPLDKVVLDIGCGSGRYGQLFTKYHGMDVWPDYLEYARNQSPHGKYYLGGVFDPWPIKPDIVLTLNVFRHFLDPETAYKHVWANLEPGTLWVTDFLVHNGTGLKIDGDFSSLVSKAFMDDFLKDKPHSVPKNWLHEVGDWWLTRIEK